MSGAQLTRPLTDSLDNVISYSRFSVSNLAMSYLRTIWGGTTVQFIFKTLALSIYIAIRHGLSRIVHEVTYCKSKDGIVLEIVVWYYLWYIQGMVF